jgi:hypothetical protein
MTIILHEVQSELGQFSQKIIHYTETGKLHDIHIKLTTFNNFNMMNIYKIQWKIVSDFINSFAIVNLQM